MINIWIIYRFKVSMSSQPATARLPTQWRKSETKSPRSGSMWVTPPPSIVRWNKPSPSSVTSLMRDPPSDIGITSACRTLLFVYLAFCNLKIMRQISLPSIYSPEVPPSHVITIHWILETNLSFVSIG